MLGMDEASAQAARRHDHSLTFDLTTLRNPAFSVDTNRIVVAWNTAAERWFGLDARQTIGQRCVEVLRVCHLPPCHACQRTQTAPSLPADAQPASQGAPCAMWTFSAQTQGSGLRIVHLLTPPDRSDGAGGPMKSAATSASSLAPPLTPSPAPSPASAWRDDVTEPDSYIEPAAQPW